MPHLVVSSLSHLHTTAKAHGAREMITLLSSENDVKRPASIRPDRHLFLNMNDISVQIDSLRLPEDHHITRLIEFAQAWDRSAPLLIHCWMGISRSTAAAYITALALNPALDEERLASNLRQQSPTATPNRRMIALADSVLEREGRMVSAIERIGRGAETSIGMPFVLPLETG
ncbi:MAG: tyrosine phosphatase family protein [Alphaproteobacteria bacterium]|nr:tyrosine phosphatase family protein [Alphaproteobacteria bacterium]